MQKIRKFDPNAVFRSLNLTSDQTPARLFITDHASAGESSFDMHFELEMGFLFSGRAKRIYGEFEKEVGPGEIWLCGIWEPHGIQIVEAPCRSAALVLRPDLLSELSHAEFQNADLFSLFRSPPEKRAGFPCVNSRDMAFLAEKLPRLSAEEDPTQLVWCKMLLRAALLYLRKHLESPTTKPLALQESYQRIARGLELVYASQKFTSTVDAAKACGMSRNGFQDLFGKVMGISFYQFSLRHRLKQAVQLIGSSGLSMDRIAFQCGFSDARHLYRAFEKNFGFSVAEYRNSNKEL